MLIRALGERVCAMDRFMVYERKYLLGRKNGIEILYNHGKFSSKQNNCRHTLSLYNTE